MDAPRRDHRTIPRKNPARSDAEKMLDSIRKGMIKQAVERRNKNS